MGFEIDGHLFFLCNFSSLLIQTYFWSVINVRFSIVILLVSMCLSTRFSFPFVRENFTLQIYREYSGCFVILYKCSYCGVGFHSTCLEDCVLEPECISTHYNHNCINFYTYKNIFYTIFAYFRAQYYTYVAYDYFNNLSYSLS